MKELLHKLKSLIHFKQFKSRKSKQGYILLYKKDNKRLFSLLNEAAFFDFHITNNQHIVGLHQVVAYIYHGWRAYLNNFTAAKGDVEIHHIDSDPSNNSPGNLIYVSPQEHLLISQATSIQSTTFVRHCDPCPFNKKGHPISNPFKRLSYLVFITINRTFKKLGIRFSVPQFNILSEIPLSYTFKRINWCPAFLKSLYRELAYLS